MHRPLAAAAVAIALGIASPARASFSDAEQHRLFARELVEQRTEIQRGRERYVGGVSYRLVHARADGISLAIRRVDALAYVLPNVSGVSFVGIDKAGRVTVDVTHQLKMFEGRYRVEIEYSNGGMYGRFWLVPTPNAAVRDAWGFVRLTPVGADETLVTWALLFDLGPGMLRTLFEEQIVERVLSVPTRIANLVGG